MKTEMIKQKPVKEYHLAGNNAGACKAAGRTA